MIPGTGGGGLASVVCGAGVSEAVAPEALSLVELSQLVWRPLGLCFLLSCGCFPRLVSCESQVRPAWSDRQDARWHLELGKCEGGPWLLGHLEAPFRCTFSFSWVVEAPCHLTSFGGLGGRPCCWFRYSPESPGPEGWAPRGSPPQPSPASPCLSLP